MIESPRILTTESVPYAGLHLEVPVAEIRHVMEPGIAEVLAALKAQDIRSASPWFTHHFHRPMTTFDFEICFPVASPFAPAGRVVPGVWPAMRVARTVFRGDYSGLPAAWGELEKWMESEGHAGGSEFWERYLTNPHTHPNPEDWQTELNWPLQI